MKSNILVKKANNRSKSQKSNNSNVNSLQRISNQSTDSLISLAKNRKLFLIIKHYRKEN